MKNTKNILYGLFEKIPLELILVECSKFSRTALKKRLYDEGLKNRECEICGQGEIWNGKKISLILDHKNGINNDNRIENLRIVCPNCNATLDTHCGKNKKNRKLTSGFTKQSYEKCHLSQRKTKRPSFEELKREIKNEGYSATGRKYGVSDNAIRKWEKAYLKYGI